MVSRVQLARMVLAVSMAETTAIETMHPADLDNLAAAKQALVTAAADIISEEGAIGWDQRGIFADLSN